MVPAGQTDESLQQFKELAIFLNWLRMSASEIILMSLRLVAFFAVLLPTLGASAAAAQTPAPAAPDKYDVEIRYHIEAARTGRVRQYNELLKTLKNIGFVLDASKVEETDPEDNQANRLFGTIDAGQVPQLLQVRNLTTVLLTPHEFKLPEDKAATVRVQLLLAAMPSLERQRQLADQVRQALKGLGFKESVAYDHRGFTRLVGSLPAGQLQTVLGDIRLVPSGWSLFGTTFLADLAATRSGGDILESILTDWTKTAAGKRIVDAVVDEWSAEPAAKKLAATLPLDAKDPIEASVLNERLMAQMAHSPEAREKLQSLFGRVLRSEAAPELMRLLLNRANARLTGTELPLLYRTVTPVRIIEVQNMPEPLVRVAAPVVPAGLEHLDPELRELLKDESRAKQPLRLEVLLARTPEADDADWRTALTSGVNLVIEGRVGSLVTVICTPADAVKLSTRPEVVGVRLPRLGRSRYQALNSAAAPPTAMDYTNLVQLYDKGHRGQGARVAVVDSDFRGWEQAVADHKLPEKTRLVDLTRERNRNLEPDPYPQDDVAIGFGTRNAMNTARAVPEAELVLVRIDPAAPYMLQNLAKAINCDGYRSIALDQRQRELQIDQRLLQNKLETLLRERHEVLENYSEDFDKEAESRKAMEAFKAHQKQYDDEDKALQRRFNTFLQYRRDLDDMKKVRLVSSGLNWNDGHPVDGGSALSRWFDDRPFKGALWFQTVGDARGQAWSGLFRDSDGNGVMEFAPAGAILPKGSWTNEVNFLSWQSPKDGESLELPANAKVRVSLQWQEAHEAALAESGLDAYRNPLANLKIVLIYEPDPEGKKEPADDVMVAAESVGPPLRLQAAANHAIYEQTLTFTVGKPGRYALRIEGVVPESTRPSQFPTLPAAVKTFELRPRLFVETLDGPGRALLQTYRGDSTETGVPADAHSVIPIGEADKEGKTKGGAPAEKLPERN